ncbi:MAG: glycine cleavage system protein H [Sphingobacterium siyangense]
MFTPEELLYTETHLWLRKIGSNDYCVGITDFAQRQIGEIYLVEIDSGMNIKIDYPFAFAHGFNETFSLIMPYECQIITMNTTLNQRPIHINIDPYNCWFLAISMQPTEDMFLTSKQYKQLIKSHNQLL